MRKTCGSSSIRADGVEHIRHLSQDQMALELKRTVLLTASADLP
jgi:hypothetical protein